MSRVGQYGSVTFLPKEMVYSESLVVFPQATRAAFCALQSRPHQIWARFFGSTLEDRLRYTPSDVFETFPFPREWTTNAALEAAGEAYYSYRADLMARHDEGLTKTYNRFHDPHEHAPDIERLRELHGEMDEAVLAAYGWNDLSTACEFVPENKVEGEARSSRRRKRYRYGWPDSMRNEVLARLVELNNERAEEEVAPLATASVRQEERRR